MNAILFAPTYTAGWLNWACEAGAVHGQQLPAAVACTPNGCAFVLRFCKNLPFLQACKGWHKRSCLRLSQAAVCDSYRHTDLSASILESIYRVSNQGVSSVNVRVMNVKQVRNA